MHFRFLSSSIALGTMLATAPVASGAPITVVEFYNITLKHYVLITDPAEVAAIDNGAAGPGWEHTGGTLDAFSDAGDEAGLVAVCRFYGDVAAGGPNSHFYTADPAECASVRLDPGWHYEGIAFYIQLPANRQCPSPQKPVYRAYNNGFHAPPAVNDGNHRFSLDHSAIDQLVSQGWTDEGVVFCAGGGTLPAADSGACLVPPVGFTGSYVSSVQGQSQQVRTTGTASAPIETVTLQIGPATVTSTTPLQVTAASNGDLFLTRGPTHTEVSYPGVQIVEDIDTGGRIPMTLRPGVTAEVSGNASGTISISGPVSCSSPVSGSYHWEFTFIGREPITIATGSYNACRFRYKRFASLNINCEAGFGSGSASDTLAMWFVEGMGMVRSLSDVDGTTIELQTFTH